MTVAMQDAPPGRNDEAMAIWIQVGAFFTRHHDRIERRLDRLETDVAGLRAAVSGLETDVTRLGTAVASLETDVTRLGTAVANLETDVAGLKTAVASLEERVDRMDRSMARGFARIDAQFERLVALIQPAETTGT